MAELLVLPALIAYGEAAVAYAGELRGSGSRYGRVGIWGVRIGWLAQTALLVAQALSADGFPWGTWAGALNLLSWLVVSAYLVWGSKPRYRLVGLGVMPVAAGLLVLAWAGGGTGVDESDGNGWALAVHAGLMLAAFASFLVAAATASLYLYEDRGLSRHDTRLVRLRLPSLEGLERVSARAVLAGLLLLTAGIVVGLVGLDVDGVDAAMTVTVAIWAFYGVVLLLRREAGLQGRRLAWSLVAGAVLVAVVLPLTHFAA
jgi:ABC-type transport system involved in cytochrome c biogenesis permease subunit